MAQVVQLFVYHYTDIQKLTVLNFRHVVLSHVVFSFGHISVCCHTLHLNEFLGSGLICSSSTTFKLVAL